MGYNTNYTLEWEAQDNYEGLPSCEHAVRKGANYCPECGNPVGTIGLNEIVENYIKSRPETLGYALQPDGSPSEEAKWYEWFPDMIVMSSKIKNVLFKLHGEGKENIDIWDAYFLNGMGQWHRAKIVIAPMNKKDWTTTKPTD